jgi:hypothetical protein
MILGLGDSTDPTGTAALQAFLNAWHLHPPGFTAAELAGYLQAGADYGTKINASRPIQLFPDYDPAPLLQQIAAATSEADVWRGKLPWFWQSPTYYAKSGPEALAVEKRLTQLYQEAAGIQGASETVAAAQTELVQTLTTPGKWEWLQAARPYLIAGGIIVAAAVAYPYIKKRGLL